MPLRSPPLPAGASYASDLRPTSSHPRESHDGNSLATVGRVLKKGRSPFMTPRCERENFRRPIESIASFRGRTEFGNCVAKMRGSYNDWHLTSCWGIQESGREREREREREEHRRRISVFMKPKYSRHRCRNRQRTRLQNQMKHRP